ncbi:MAG: hypothetical protein AB7E52_00595 [Bdellovibrionales bacterium]
MKSLLSLPYRKLPRPVRMFGAITSAMLVLSGCAAQGQREPGYFPSATCSCSEPPPSWQEGGVYYYDAIDMVQAGIAVAAQAACRALHPNDPCFCCSQRRDDRYRYTYY